MVTKRMVLVFIQASTLTPSPRHFNISQWEDGYGEGGGGGLNFLEDLWT